MSNSSRSDHLQKGADVSTNEALIAGSISGGLARAVTAPLDTIKIRLQIQPHRGGIAVGALQTTRELIKNEGVLGLWKGNVPAELMYIMYGAVQFSSYSLFNKAYEDFAASREIVLKPHIHSLLVGLSSGVVSTLSIYPFDLLRTRLAANSHKNFLSMSKTIKSILRQDGIIGLFAGIKPTMLSVATNTGVMFWSYELARDISRQYNDVPFIEGMCGFIAGASAKGVTFPLDTVRKRNQMYSSADPTMERNVAISLTKSILKNEGVLAFYRGFGISILKTAPTTALSLYIYEYSLDYLKR